MGWQPNTYAAYEKGSRAVPRQMLAAIAGAFGVSEQWLLTGAIPDPRGDDGHRVDYLEILSSTSLKEIPKRLAAQGATDLGPNERLALARRMAGFKNALAAIAHFRFDQSSYYGHESGRQQLTARKAASYARAFDVTASWLLHGLPPSGLPVSKEWTEDQWLGARAGDTDLPAPDPRRRGDIAQPVASRPGNAVPRAAVSGLGRVRVRQDDCVPLSMLKTFAGLDLGGDLWLQRVDLVVGTVTRIRPGDMVLVDGADHSLNAQIAFSIREKFGVATVGERLPLGAQHLGKVLMFLAVDSAQAQHR
jgi:transcriptional regulator with XRE-family HTH domain